MLRFMWNTLIYLIFCSSAMNIFCWKKKPLHKKKPKTAEHLWCRSLTMLIIMWGRFELKTKFKACYSHKDTQTMIRVAWPFSTKGTTTGKFKLAPLICTWDHLTCPKVKMANDAEWCSLFIRTASSHAWATLQCRNKTFEMSWKTKRVQHHTGQAETAEQFCICVCMWACIRFTCITPVQHYYCTPQCK